MEDKKWQLISDQTLWDNSLLASSSCNFLQSASFGVFHEKLGNKVWRLGLAHGNKIVGFAQTVQLRSKLNSFLYVPWGPILQRPEDLKGLVETLREVGKSEGADFVRFEPRTQLDESEKLGLKKISTYTQPQCSLVLDLTRSLDELKKDLSDSTRYNVGWVERQGLTVETSRDQGDVEIFLELLQETASRQKFRLHQSSNYYKEQFNAFADKGQAKLFITKAPTNQGKAPLAAAIVVYFGDTATYLHAASSSQQQKLRAPYLMQWRIIEDAKGSGFKKYDFWGVARTDHPGEPWAGVTAFKKSFGGEKVCYPEPFDLVLTNKYYLSNLIEKFRPVVRFFQR